MRIRLLAPVMVLVMAPLAAAPACGDEGPDISLPDVTLPDVSIPEVSLPDVSLPDVSLPDVSLPEVSLPDVSLPPVTIPAPPPPDAGDPDDGDGAVAAPEPTSPAIEPSPVVTDPATADPEEVAAEEGGVPWWVWLLIAVAVALAVVLIVVLARRRGSDDAERALAAEADGQLAWARSHVDDGLVRWRASQLGAAADQRDVDSEVARRWTGVDQRLGAAIDRLLTLESRATKPEAREAAFHLREAVERYRATLDTVASAYASGDESRVDLAIQQWNADTGLLDGARARFREITGLDGAGASR